MCLTVRLLDPELSSPKPKPPPFNRITKCLINKREVILLQDDCHSNSQNCSTLLVLVLAMLVLVTQLVRLVVTSSNLDSARNGIANNSCINKLNNGDDIWTQGQLPCFPAESNAEKSAVPDGGGAVCLVKALPL